VATAVNALFTLIHLAGIGGLLAFLVRPAWREAFARRCIGVATARDLAFVRIVICAVLIAYVCWEDLASQARLGPKWFKAPGYLASLQNLFVWLHGSAARLEGVTWLLLAATVLGLAGVATRVMLPLALALYILFAGLLRSFGKDFHAGYLVGYVLLALCFSPAGDAWSFDSWYRRWKQRRAPPVTGTNETDEHPRAPRTSYEWGVWSCYAAACIPYLQLSASKLANGGWYWFEGRGMRNYVLLDALNLVESDFGLGQRFYDAPTLVFALAGLLGLLIELLYPLVLVLPRARLPLAALTMLLHTGIWVSQDALFLDAILVPLIFFGPSRWWRVT
jgi:hypothetical protein